MDGDTRTDSDGNRIGPNGEFVPNPHRSGVLSRTNDATLWSWRWDNDAGAYLVFLEFVCNGDLICDEHVATIHFDGRVERHTQPLAGSDRGLRPSHGAVYAVVDLIYSISFGGSGEPGNTTSAGGDSPGSD